MISYDDMPETVEMTLTQPEGRHLLEFLESSGGNGYAEEFPPTLRAVEERLDDASALAGWLREYVRLELDSAEAADLLGLMSTPLKEEWSISGEAESALATVREKVAGCLSCVTAERK